MADETTNYVSLKSLAEELGLDRSNMRKYVLKAGLEPHKRRTPDSANQLTLAITPDEAQFIRAKRREEGYDKRSVVVSTDIGVFYIIQLVPELDPRRLKLGYADNIDNRLSQHRTAAPTATVSKSWPCKRTWESTVMDALTAKHCRLILNEVFECDEPDTLMRFADTLFDLLPNPKERPPLSDHSPHNT